MLQQCIEYFNEGHLYAVIVDTFPFRLMVDICKFVSGLVKVFCVLFICFLKCKFVSGLVNVLW